MQLLIGHWIFFFVWERVRNFAARTPRGKSCPACGQRFQPQKV